MRTDEQRAHHAAISKRSYDRRKALGVRVARAAKVRYDSRRDAGLCVGCEVKRDPTAGDTGTQCRECADYRNEQRREVRA